MEQKNTMERKFRAPKSSLHFRSWNESSPDQKFSGTKVLGNESSQERMFPFAPGAKVPKSVGHKRLVEKLKWYGVDGEVNS